MWIITLSSKRCPTNFSSIPNGYDSKHEADIAADLHMRELAENIAVLEQVPFKLPGGTKYIADFVILYPGGRFEVVDAKGVRTDVFTLKKKLLREAWEVDITEV